MTARRRRLPFDVQRHDEGPIGPFKATNKSVVIHGIDVDEMRGARFETAVTYSNATELLTYLGALPAKPAGK